MKKPSTHKIPQGTSPMQSAKTILNKKRFQSLPVSRNSFRACRVLKNTETNLGKFYDSQITQIDRK
jgi:hypothetical protein